MHGSERLLDVLYRSVLHPENIGEFVTELQQVTKAHSAAVVVHDYATGNGHVPVLLGLPVGAAMAYEQRYAAQNLWFERNASQTQTGSTHLSDDYVSLRELKQTEYWREFLSLIDIDHCVDSCGIRDHGKVVMLNVFHSHRNKHLIPSSLALFKQLTPHWVNACAIQRKLGLLEETLTRMQQALNKVALAVVLLDSTGAICRMNEGAERLLRSAALVGQRARRLAARQPQDAQALDHAVAAALTTGTELGANPNVTSQLVLHDAQGQPAAFVSVHALIVPRAPDPETRQARALVFIRPLNGSDANGLSEALIALYRLTASEARFAVALQACGDLAKASADVGIRVDTARTKMKQIYDKIGLHNQAGLAKLISDLGFTLG